MRVIRFAMAAMLVLAVLAVSSTSQASGRCLPVTWGSLPKASNATGTGTHLVGVRAGQHNCFDRFVIDLDGAVSGYRVEYVTALHESGSGNPVPMTGGAIIQIIALAPAYDDGGKPTVDPATVDGLAVGGYRTFRDVAWAGSFEGQTGLGLGVRARLPFRVFTLSGPGDGSRVVIDVAHNWTGATTPTKPEPTLPGEPFEGPVVQGSKLAVMGVAHDDVLNIRALPGADQRIVATVAPTADDVVATGRGRLLPRQIWYEVTVDGTTGWARSSFLAALGGTDDETSEYLGGDLPPAAENMSDLGRRIAADFASEDPPSRIVQSVAPTVGDLAEVTYDVVGLGDDSVAGVRLHIFAVPHDSGHGFELKSIEVTDFCSRGSDGTICV